jgi:hypothetical protein
MSRLLLRFLLLGGFLATVPMAGRTSLADGPEPDDQGLVPMFVGNSFDGWKKVGGGATYQFDGETIVGKVGPGSNTFLRTEKTYGDFILKLDLKLDIPGNSGIQFRSHQRESADGNGRVFGYQCEVDPSPRAWSAGIYDEGRRGWLFPSGADPEAQKAFTEKSQAQKTFKLDDWNHYTIVAQGPHLRTWLNGIPCADLIDTMDLDGFIALQVHAGKAGQIRWKNVRIKELGRSTWKPLWDGRTLDGWRKIGGGDWTIEDGAIHGTSSRGERRHGLLITDATYDDFAVRLQFKDSKGNSGLYFRCEEGGDAGVLGLQAEIADRPDDLGGLYETGGRGWIARPLKKEEPQKGASKKGASKKATATAPDEGPRDGWSELAVVALGDRVVVQVNGRTTAEIRDPQARKKGHIALQLHGGQDMDVQFKGVEIQPLVEKSGERDRPRRSQL